MKNKEHIAKAVSEIAEAQTRIENAISEIRKITIVKGGMLATLEGLLIDIQESKAKIEKNL